MRLSAGFARLRFRSHPTARKAVRVDLDVELLDRCHQDMAAVGLAAQDGREQAGPSPADGSARPRETKSRRARCACPNGRSAPDSTGRPAAVGAASISCCSSARLTPLNSIGGRLSGMALQSLDCFAASRSRQDRCNDGQTNRHRDRRRKTRRRGDRRGRCSPTAGTCVAHVHHATDDVPDGAIKAVADLAEPDCADVIFAAAAGMPPGAVAGQQCRAFRLGRLRGVRARRVRRAHGGQRAGAGAADRTLRARRTTKRRDALVVNLLDSKLAAPNPDYLSYTLSKQALAGVHRAWRRVRLRGAGIRVNGDRAGADASVERAERGEFRRDARQ